MTEQQWLACADPEGMLAFLGGAFGRRRLRLFAAACCRRVWALIPDERGRRAVETAERHARGLAGDDELEKARRAAAPRGRAGQAGHAGLAAALAQRAAWAAA